MLQRAKRFKLPCATFILRLWRTLFFQEDGNMRTISQQERDIAIETGMFEGENLDDGIYSAIKVERIDDSHFRLVFEEHGQQFSAEAEFDEHLAQKILYAHREFRLNRRLGETGRFVP
jgi:hypothetical protein